jgi:hypothetical protein
MLATQFIEASVPRPTRPFTALDAVPESRRSFSSLRSDRCSWTAAIKPRGFDPTRTQGWSAFGVRSASRPRRTALGSLLAQFPPLSSRMRIARVSTSKMTAADQPNSKTPFIAVIGPSRRQRCTGKTSP